MGIKYLRVRKNIYKKIMTKIKELLIPFKISKVVFRDFNQNPKDGLQGDNLSIHSDRC